MARTGDEQEAAQEAAGPRDRVAAGAVVGAHTLQHLYQHGFYVILPEVYAALSLTPIAGGAIETARRVAGGVASMGGGFVLDRFQDKRILVLYLSLLTMGLGYLLVGVAPTYVVILVAVALANAAGSIWHPAALSLLSQRYPHRRGFWLALHRAAGSVGDVTGPLLVGALLTVLVWQGVLYGALPLALVFALLLWVVLRKAPQWQATTQAPTGERRSFREQSKALGAMLRGRSLRRLLLVGAFNGLGQGGLLVWLGIYLSETQGMGSVGIGVHTALLTGFGIVAGPLTGMLSDRVGRKPVIAGVLAAKSLIAVGMALAGSGVLLSLLVALMGTVMFGANSLIQAGALDVADGHDLEGSMIGLLWGVNALFAGLSPLVLGVLVQGIGFAVLFWYVAAVNALATVMALMLPRLERRGR
ncbi:MFS transporter [Egibacter rhizosphaerae]|uniref:MFS transporter n=1 Tax=Egibacter rhizosphaerae TaxID=1670831 RepID=A0A411YIC7_9ACTN|nr:MFS transporter [Egibacter rhizosphaerae]QBI21065.1 MFS transporter [Egibacter rhizosphaerae]